MNLRTLEQHHLMDIYEQYAQPVPFFKCIEIEHDFMLGNHSYSCKFEVSLKLWRDEDGYPSVDCISAVDAYDQGGHVVTAKGILNILNLMATGWAMVNVDELAEEARNK